MDTTGKTNTMTVLKNYRWGKNETGSVAVPELPGDELFRLELEPGPNFELALASRIKAVAVIVYNFRYKGLTHFCITNFSKADDKEPFKCCAIIAEAEVRSCPSKLGADQKGLGSETLATGRLTYWRTLALFWMRLMRLGNRNSRNLSSCQIYCLIKKVKTDFLPLLQNNFIIFK